MATRCARAAAYGHGVALQRGRLTHGTQLHENDDMYSIWMPDYPNEVRGCSGSVDDDGSRGARG